jgi:two-component system, OmpR family, KDP operon response regulator KdpE
MENVARKSSAAIEHLREIPQNAENVASRRVLVVDDEPLARWAIAETLAAIDCAVIEAGDAQSALHLVAEGADLVLLDLHLPDADDLSVLARMRLSVPETPIILMTAFPTSTTVEGAAAYGVPVLTKPFDLADLAARVEQALGGIY